MSTQDTKEVTDQQVTTSEISEQRQSSTMGTTVSSNSNVEKTTSNSKDGKPLSAAVDYKTGNKKKKNKKKQPQQRETKKVDCAPQDTAKTTNEKSDCENVKELNKQKSGATDQAKKQSVQAAGKENSDGKRGMTKKELEVKEARVKFIAMTYEQKKSEFNLRKSSVKLDQIQSWPFDDGSISSDQKSLPSSTKDYGDYTPKDTFTPDEDLNAKVCMWQGDITRLEIDCIVNAANSSLLGGGGVDGAIHDAAGYQLLDECKLLQGCKAGKVKDTAGYLLPARYILHTVGPFGEKADVLKDCYKNCLDAMIALKQKSIAFPCVATGVYGYPNERAVHVVLKTVRTFLEDKKINNELNRIDRVIFCLFLDIDLKLYGHWLKHYFPVPESSASPEQKPPASPSQDSQLEGEDPTSPRPLPNINVDSEQTPAGITSGSSAQDKTGNEPKESGKMIQSTPNDVASEDDKVSSTAGKSSASDVASEENKVSSTTEKPSAKEDAHKEGKISSNQENSTPNKVAQPTNKDHKASGSAKKSNSKQNPPAKGNVPKGAKNS